MEQIKRKIGMIFGVLVAMMLFSTVAVYAAEDIHYNNDQAQTFNERLVNAEDAVMANALNHDMTEQAMVNRDLERGEAWASAADYKNVKVNEEDQQLVNEQTSANEEKIVRDEIKQDDTPIKDRDEYRAESYVNAIFYKPGQQTSVQDSDGDHDIDVNTATYNEFGTNEMMGY